MSGIPRETLINIVTLGVCMLVMCVLFVAAEWQVQRDLAQQRQLLTTLERIYRERQRREHTGD